MPEPQPHQTSGPASSAPASPSHVDAATGLPQREVRSGVTVNADPKREAPSLAFCIEAARMLADDKCEDVMVLDLRGRSQVTDFFVIASGSSDRQLRSAADHVAQEAKKSGIGVYRSNLDEARANWIVLDMVDVVLHVLMPETRRYYDIEMLWGDAPRLSWKRESDGPSASEVAKRAAERNRAGLTPGDILPGNRRG